MSRTQSTLVVTFSKVSVLLVSLFFVSFSPVGCKGAAQEIGYVFHYTITDAEISELPTELTELARLIQNREMNTLDSTRFKSLFMNCPYRSSGKKRIRMLWGLDGNRPSEGQKAIWVDLDASGTKVVECGFVFVG